MTIEMVRDVLGWHMSAGQKIAMIEMLVDGAVTKDAYCRGINTGKKTATEVIAAELKALRPFVAKSKVSKGPVSGTYRRGLLWSKCKREHPRWAAKQVYGNLSNVDMEKFLARAAAKVK